MGKYAYYTLQEKGWLRVLVIQPSRKRDDIVRGSLLHQPIESLEKEGYEALSYCWGSDKESIRIEIDGTQFLVRPPLHAALLRLRDTTEPRTIWIDAICINQDDVAERNNQVAQMRDVYSKATRVVVWLGNGDCRGKFGMHILERWARAAKKIEDKWMPIVKSNPIGKHEFYAEWTALYRGFQVNKFSFRYRLACVVPLFFLDWWERMWTVQELVLAREAVMQYGDMTTSWRDFEIIAKLHTVQAVHSQSVERESGMKMRATKLAWTSFMAAENLRTLIFRREDKIPVSLSLILDSTRARLSTDPRDKIFAVLGVVDLPIASRPDYSKKWQDVYTTAMKDVLSESKDLRAYHYLPINNPDGSNGLPSWVPNFGQKGGEAPAIRRLCFGSGGAPEDPVHQIAYRPLYFAGLTSHWISIPNRIVFEGNDKILKLKGLRYDSVSKMGGQAPLEGTLRNEIMKWRSLVSGLQTPYGLGTSETTNEAFWRTVCLDCKVHFFHPDITIKDNPRDVRRRLNSPDKLIPPRSPREQERLLLALDEQVEWNEGFQPGRVFFFTSKGHMGMGPPWMKVGDVIAVLIGSETPFIIREICPSRYHLIGQCYLHGIMDGEAIETPLQKGFGLEDIRIV
ncbi:HET-domain-containing protein [Cladorrhinum sp. PSN332]|nr:HET-domain-containing protein [Cladorrhinum sp. PSN332]